MEDAWLEWEKKYRNRNIINLSNNNMQSNSKKYSLNKTDSYKLGRLGLIMLGSTVLTYVSSIYMDINFAIPMRNGQILNITPVLIPIITLLIDTCRKFLNNYQESATIEG